MTGPATSPIHSSEASKNAELYPLLNGGQRRERAAGANGTPQLPAVGYPTQPSSPRAMRLRRILPIPPALLPLLLTLLLPCLAHAFRPEQLIHTPPEAQGHDSVEIRLGAQDIRGARLLVAALNGYKVVPLERDGGDFVARISFGERAVLRYQFQVEAATGGFYESSYYEVRQRTDPEVESRVRTLIQEEQRLRARVVQLENTLPSLKRMDPRILGQRRSQEMAKAVVQLREAERSLQAERSALTKLLEKLSSEGEESHRELRQEIEEALREATT